MAAEVKKTRKLSGSLKNFSAAKERVFMELVPKCVKQHSFNIDDETMEELWEIASRYGSVKNYVYSRYTIKIAESPRL